MPAHLPAVALRPGTTRYPRQRSANGAGRPQRGATDEADAGARRPRWRTAATPGRGGHAGLQRGGRTVAYPLAPMTTARERAFSDHSARAGEQAIAGHNGRVPADGLGVIAEAAARCGETLELAARHLDSSLVEVLRLIGFDASYVAARGSYLYDARGRPYLDLHTGEGFASLGHNHPDVRAVLQSVLAADLVDGVQIHYSVLAGMLAQELCARLPPGLEAVFFTNSGAEAVDSAMKFARAATRRRRLLSCDSAFHGVTLGPLGLVGDDFFKEGFGPMLPGCARVPFGDLDRLEAQLRRRDVAAFIVEPIQGREVRLPPPGYLRAAQELCRRHGTLFIVDEIQTGLGRTGRWFALERDGLTPDFVLVGKALSGGYMPVAAMVTTRSLYQRAVGTLERSYVHQSTFGRNRLSMAAGLAVLRVIARDGLVEHADAVGRLLAEGLQQLATGHPMIRAVRARGLMVGIELGAPNGRIARLNWHLIHLASKGLFPQLVVIPLHRDHGMITMAAGKNDVIKLLPPLTLSRAEATSFLDALDAVLSDCERSSSASWREVRGIAQSTLRRRVAQLRSPAGSARSAEAAAGAAAEGKVAQGAAPAADRQLCLVTGASGFIGGHLVAALLRSGWSVRGLVRASSDTRLLRSLGAQLAGGELTDAASVARAAQDCRFVVHCGAMVSDWATVKEITDVNVHGTRNVLRACASAGVARMIHISTTDIYGHPGGRRLIDESFAPARFANWYSHTKLQAESEVRAASAGGLETVILRPATVYGPRSVNVVGEIAAAIRAGRMVLISGGRAIAGLCYVDNLVDAILLAITHSAAAGETFNVTDGLHITWREFLGDLAAGLGCPPPRLSIPYPAARALGFALEQGYRLARAATGLQSAALLSRQAVDVMGRDQSFSNARLRRTLGWEPRVDYRSGLQATLAWLGDEASSAMSGAVAGP
jgi:ornithine--oxo-acid transaminase